jgi:hypothetical protein
VPIAEPEIATCSVLSIAMLCTPSPHTPSWIALTTSPFGESSTRNVSTLPCGTSTPSPKSVGTENGPATYTLPFGSIATTLPSGYV